MRLLFLALALCAAAPRPSAAQLPRRAEPLIVAGAVLAGAALLDAPVDRAIPAGGGTRLDWATRGLNHGGRPVYAVVALGGAYAGGRLADAPELSSSAAHMLAALLASGVANGTLKYAVGRERPSATDDPLSFRPFNPNNRWQAFPSGHAVVAFSLATSLSEEAGRPWVTALAFGGATLVGWSRIYDDKHWTSDVTGGALVGYGVSRATLRLLHRRRPHPDGARVLVLPNALLVRIPLPSPGGLRAATLSHRLRGRGDYFAGGEQVLGALRPSPPVRLRQTAGGGGASSVSTGNSGLF